VSWLDVRVAAQPALSEIALVTIKCSHRVDIKTDPSNPPEYASREEEN
jgi:hypothetical protein